MGELGLEIEQLFGDPKAELEKLLHVHRQRNRSDWNIQIDFRGLDFAQLHDGLPLIGGANAIPAGLMRISSRSLSTRRMDAITCSKLANLPVAAESDIAQSDAIYLYSRSLKLRACWKSGIRCANGTFSEPCAGEARNTGPVNEVLSILSDDFQLNDKTC